MKTEKELGQALKSGMDTIEIEGDLARKTIRIKATGKVTWVVAIGAVAVAVVAAGATLGSAGTAAPVAGPVAVVSLGAAATVWGVPTAATAVAIALAGGGIATLGSLRKYRLEKISDNKVILYRR